MLRAVFLLNYIRMRKVLDKKFFKKDTLHVAKGLLGKYLCRRRNGKEICLMITEVEAYDGFSDKASHASRGRTLRNAVMFGEEGRWYVYFVYGTHWMLNIVTGPEDYPAAVLIRGVEGFGGPAKLTKFLKINKQCDGQKALRKTGLWIEDRGIKINHSKIKAGPRIGVDYAGVWAKKPYRFILTKY